MNSYTNKIQLIDFRIDILDLSLDYINALSIYEYENKDLD